MVSILNIQTSNIYDITGIEYFINLINLGISSNHITTANLSSLTQLQYLGLINNPMTSLNVTGLSNLSFLSCFNCQLTSIDVSTCNNLSQFYGNNNNFTSLDFSNNHLLNKMSCSNNPNLISIKIKNDIAQQYYNQSNFIDCWTNGNPNLSYICADDFEIADLQAYLTGCNATQTIVVDSLCPLATDDFVSVSFKLFPNPTSSIFTIQSDDTIKSFFLYDIQGRLLLNKDINTTSTSVDICDKSKGVYLIKVVGENGYSVKKIVKE